MLATNIQRVDSNGTAKLSGEIDDFTLWYEFPSDLQTITPGDAFLCAGLLIAMRQGKTLKIDAPCSPSLLSNARDTLQEIFCSWFPELKRVEVVAEEATLRSADMGVGSFFSGGVDGSYTFLQHVSEITHLVSVQGIDVQITNDNLWKQIEAANHKFADEFGKKFVCVRTNIRHWCHPRGIAWAGKFNGCGLASIAHALGLHRYYIAATHTHRELFPWGSHPLSDCLWGSDTIELIHDGMASRAEKLRFIGKEQLALNMLRVCWHDAGYNCGVCEKCIRTRTALRLLGLSTPTLAPLSDVRELSRLQVWDSSEESFFQDNLTLADSIGDTQVVDAIRRCLKRYRSRRALADLDQNILGGFVHWAKSIFQRR